MNCIEWQEKIALFSGGDIEGADAAIVEEHLAECPECRAVAEGLRESRAMLLSLRVVDDDEIEVVRSGVLRRLRERRSPAWLTWLPYAAAIAVLVFGVGQWRSRVEPPARVARVAPQATATETPAAGAVEKTIVPAERLHRVRRKSAPPAVSVQQAEPTVVTLYTDDPDVVIVWITD